MLRRIQCAFGQAESNQREPVLAGTLGRAMKSWVVGCWSGVSMGGETAKLSDAKNKAPKRMGQ